jgi:hypothetical protein
VVLEAVRFQVTCMLNPAIQKTLVQHYSELVSSPEKPDFGRLVDLLGQEQGHVWNLIYLFTINASTGLIKPSAVRRNIVRNLLPKERSSPFPLIDQRLQEFLEFEMDEEEEELKII